MPQTTSPDIRNPKGYALLMGINDYKNAKLNNLTECINDVAYWKGLFTDVWKYDEVYTMTNAEVTDEKVYTAIWALAAKAKPGDIVVIQFSGHGMLKKQPLAITRATIENNVLVDTNGIYIRDSIVNLLLKAFKPKVRIVFIIDACQSGTFIEVRSDIPVDPLDTRLQNLISKIQNEIPADKQKIEELIQKQYKTPICASVAHIGAVVDSMYVPDGTTSTFSKNLPYPIIWYSLPEWRDAIDLQYYNLFYKDGIGLHVLLDEGEEYFKHIADFLQKWKSDFKFKGTNKEFIIHLYHTSALSTTVFLRQLNSLTSKIKHHIRFETDWKKTVPYLLDLKDLADNYNPTLYFTGQKSEAFKNQYMFNKYSLNYILENSK